METKNPQKINEFRRKVRHGIEILLEPKKAAQLMRSDVGKSNTQRTKEKNKPTMMMMMRSSAFYLIILRFNINKPKSRLLRNENTQIRKIITD